jgi:hypothetical protein
MRKQYERGDRSKDTKLMKEINYPCNNNNNNNNNNLLLLLLLVLFFIYLRAELTSRGQLQTQHEFVSTRRTNRWTKDE